MIGSIPIIRQTSGVNSITERKRNERIPQRSLACAFHEMTCSIHARLDLDLAENFVSDLEACLKSIQVRVRHLHDYLEKSCI